MDDKSSSFVAFPKDDPETAQKWSEAIAAYAAGIIPPSTTVAAAQAAMQGAMTGMSLSGAAIVIFPLAFTTFALTLAGGMAPAFTAIPPPVPIIFASVFVSGMAGAPASEIVSQMASIIDLWFRTGTAAPNPPGTVFVPWS